MKRGANGVDRAPMRASAADQRRATDRSTEADRPAADRPAADPTGAGEPAPPVALYVHVPFCVSICPYCDFVVYGGASARGPRSRVAGFLDALAREIDLRAAAAPPGAPLESVYLGGGTPSLLPPAAIEGLLDRVRARFGIARDAEVTLEVNPGPDERGDARAWRDAGVTRLSIGAQSLVAAELLRLGRRHRPGDVEATVLEARAAGIHSLGLDLLYDVPGQSLASWTRTLDRALDLRPDHLSIYALTLDDPDAEGITGPLGDHLPTRPGARRWRVAARSDQDDDRAVAEYALAVERLTADGWRGYEISNWARPGHESRHNLVYWTRRPYEAVGPGAHAFDGATRRWNAARLDAYVAALADGRLPPGGSEAIDPATARSEALILGLRLDSGVPLAADLEPTFAAVARWAAGAGLLEAAGGRIRLTTRGRMLSNEVFARLI